MTKKNKIKFSLLAGALSLITITATSVTLTSCAANPGSPYAPYTTLIINNSQNQLRYQTSSREASFWNTNSNLFPNTENNKYISKTTVEKRYVELSKEHTSATLKEGNNWETIKNLYGYVENPNSKSLTAEEYIKKANPSFFYGVLPSQQMIDLANIYNELSVTTSIYNSVVNLSNSLIRYLAFNSLPSIFANKTSVLFPFLDNQDTTNVDAARLLSGFGLSFGEGKNTYHLWPSGFTADITKISTNNTAGGIVTDVSTQVKSGSINSPFPIANYTTSDSEILLPSYELKVTNIKVNYQWYKAYQNGGEYIDSASIVNNAMTNEQKENLKKLKISSGTIGSLALALPIQDLTFNLNPKYYNYQDPFYSGLYDTVYTGLYDVNTKLNYTPQQKGELNFTNNPYPTELQTIVENKNINWRGIVNVNSLSNLKNNIPSSLYDSFEKDNKNIKSLPYFQRNMYFLNATNELSFSIPFNNSFINGFNAKQLISLFEDPYNKYSSKPTDMIIYNNVNDLDKWNYLNLWSLGWLTNNLNNKENLKNINEYKELKNRLQFKNSKYNLVAFNNQYTQYKDYYLQGLNLYYQLLQLGKVEVGTTYKFNNNGIVTSNLNVVDFSSNNSEE